MNRDTCERCEHYDDGDSYDGTGYCLLYGHYSKDNDTCDDFQEEE